MNKKGATIAMWFLFGFLYLNIYIVVKTIFDVLGK